MDDLLQKWFKGKILQLTGLDLESYRSNQMNRRIENIMKKRGATNLVEYHKILARDPEALEEFRNYLTINVSTFLRDPERWHDLRENYIPLLVKDKKWNYLQIWSAGCSNGSEPYSLAITLREMMLKGGEIRFRLVATDIDENILKEAKSGLFRRDALVNLDESMMARHFTKKGELYEINDDIKRDVDFRRHDIMDVPPGKDYDLILCRNVLIYFDGPAKDRIYKAFIDALRPGGILFIGGTEIIYKWANMGVKNLSMCFYQKSGKESSNARS